MHPLFVGFDTLEAWAAAADPARPVLVLPLALPLMETGPGIGPGGLATEDLFVLCQQHEAQPNGNVLYCRLRVEGRTRRGGEPFESEWQTRKAAWRSLAEAVEGYLAEKGLAVLRACVAWPRDLVFLDGTADGIAYDAETARYARVAPKTAPDPSKDR